MGKDVLFYEILLTSVPEESRYTYSLWIGLNSEYLEEYLIIQPLCLQCHIMKDMVIDFPMHGDKKAQKPREYWGGWVWDP